MKNSLLATAVASTLLLASSAHAFTGKIEFTGKLVDKNPYWSIGIPAKSIQDAKGWKSKLTDGKAIKGDKTEFAFKKDIPFVQGRMTKPLTKRDASNHLIVTGMTPVVTISGHKVDWKENNEPYATGPKKLSVKIKGEAYGTEIKNGQLNFTLNTGASISCYLKASDTLWKNVNTSNKDSHRSSTFLPSIMPKSKIAMNNRVSYQNLPYYENKCDQAVSAISTSIYDFKAIFDNNAIPEKWTASIPVTLSYE